jgi:xanthosine utilization system XapX-like protein
VTWLLPMAFNSEPPYGVAVDIGVGTVVAVIWALVAFRIVAPAIGLKGLLALLLSAADAIGFAAVMLWVLRRIKE